MITSPAPESTRRPRLLVLIAGVAIVALLGAGFWFAAQFQSSAQQEANAKAPPAGPVFAEITQGSLVGEVGFFGEVGPSTQTPVTVLPIPDASLAVVTGRPLNAGSTAASGQVLTEVNGRPLFGLQSAFSFYRDMGVGDRGPDVEALQVALSARSYPVSPDGRFGTETARAVTRWYEDNGYAAPTRTAAAPEKAAPVEGEKPPENSAPAPASEGYVPVTEILALPSASAQVVKGVQVGQHLAVEGEPDIVLGSADLVVTVTVAASEVGEVVAGDPATISIDGADVEGTVGEIRPAGAGAASGAADAAEGSNSGAEQGDAAPEVTFAVTPATALAASTGRARVTVTKQIVAQDALIVPVIAVADRGSDRNILTVLQADGTLVEVPVTVLGTLQGAVAIETITPGALKAGDRVRVG